MDVRRLGTRWLGIGLLMAGALALTGCAEPPTWDTYAPGQQDRYPGVHWAKAPSPEAVGWSSERLQQARNYTAELGTTAVMIVQNGVVVDAWGSVTRKTNLHSGRKSLLSGLIGIAVDRGQIDLSATMGELGIDDTAPSLTDQEKTATVRDLIRARSGIYHAALYETRRMTESKPARGSYPPGSAWHYNNWDFNALGTIYETATGRSIFEAFKAEIADPLQMEDYEVGDGEYVTGSTSVHPAYPFRMSARDFARFGLLFLRNGRWADRQIISADWVRESTRQHSRTDAQSGYGYMWWTGYEQGLFPHIRIREPAYYASGWGGQLAIVLPYLDLVIVHRVNTDWNKTNHPSGQDIGKLLWLVLAAAGVTDHGPEPDFD